MATGLTAQHSGRFVNRVLLVTGAMEPLRLKLTMVEQIMMAIKVAINTLVLQGSTVLP